MTHEMRSSVYIPIGLGERSKNYGGDREEYVHFLVVCCGKSEKKMVT